MSDLNSSKENELIKAAYATSLDPSRLEAFERFWEAYMDSQLQNKPDGFDFESLEVNAHIKTALEILNRIKTLAETESAAQHMVDSHYGFGFIVESSGRIVVANDDAVKFVYGKAYLKDCPIDQDSCENIVNWMNQRQKIDNDLCSFFHVFIGSSKRKTCWFLSPIELVSYEGETDKHHFLITSVDQQVQVHSHEAAGLMFGLTEAEANVASLLCNYLSPNEIAKNRNVKIASVRSQILSVKNKMAARDIPHIVSILTKMTLRANAVYAQQARGNRSRERSRSEETVREHSVTFRNGRNLQYFEQGYTNASSKIILNIHSLFNGCVFPKKTSIGLVRWSYRMISPVLPGYGTSDPNSISNVVSVIDARTKDLCELLDHLRIDKVHILTGWGGAIAQRFAINYPHRCSGIIFSGAVPVWDETHLNFLPPRYRNIIKTSIYAPQNVSYLIRIAKQLINSGKSREFLESLNSHNKVNLKAMENPDVYACIAQHMNLLMQQNIQTFVQDLELMHRDWRDDARRLKLPITIIKGRENGDQPAEAVLKYQEAVPHAKLKYIKGAGTYQSLTHFAHILEELKYMRGDPQDYTDKNY